MIERVVEREILDGLPHDDPEAVRSRRDLQQINAMMGNHRWLHRRLLAETKSRRRAASVIELRAGDGTLAQELAAHGNAVKALDLAPCPEGLPEGVAWRQGDLFETLPVVGGEILVACLILHHLEEAMLGRQKLYPGMCSLGDAEAIIPPFTGNGMSMAFESAESALDPLAYPHSPQPAGPARCLD